VAVLVAVWLAWGTYRVETGTQGIELVFGRYNNTPTEPGLRYNWPAPIGETLKVPVDRINRTDVGFQAAVDSRNVRDIPDESLMLTGDENIIDLDFSVLWRVRDPGLFLFRLRDPDGTVKRVAESAMREVIGHTEIQPALNEARQRVQNDTRVLMQSVLDDYESGILITEVQLQRVDPPQQVVDAFLEVQRAAADRERVRNEAEAYRNKIIPEARGHAEQMRQEAEAYKEQVLARAEGDASRFNAVRESWEIAPDVTSRRLYLETMEEVLKGTKKIIIDQPAGGQGVLPYLPLDQLMRKN
jgi:modulator of FtsH protease HflK